MTAKSLRGRVYYSLLAGSLFVGWLSLADLAFLRSSAREPQTASLSKAEFDIIEGRFHDGLGTFAELQLANEIIGQARLTQPPFDTARSEAKIRQAIDRLPESHPNRSLFETEIANIRAAAKAGAATLLQRFGRFLPTVVRHTAREFADARAGDLRLEFKDREALPVSVKTDKSNKVAIAEGQTPHVEQKWAARYFRVSTEEISAIVSDLGFASMAELKRDYLRVARLVAAVLIRKLRLEGCEVNDFSRARVGDLEALKFLFRQLRHYKSGNDHSLVIIFDRETGSVKWESLLEAIDIETLTADRVSFLPSKPRNGNTVASEFGVKIDGRAIVTFQVKHKRGRSRATASQFEFSDITTRLRL